MPGVVDSAYPEVIFGLKSLASRTQNWEHSSGITISKCAEWLAEGEFASNVEGHPLIPLEL